MIRTILAFTLAAAAASANAVDWTWQDKPEERPHYCKGFVVSGLAADEVAGSQRTELWLAWNFLIRSSALQKSTGTPEFQAGYEEFGSELDPAMAQATVADADGSCGLGRKGHQITGW